ncbi:MAG: hypothetical protein CMJ51_06100 [Planctomycetaceae bacterium]|nr:hypothetical protein [Planctomycetaceae bacterium]
MVRAHPMSARPSLEFEPDRSGGYETPSTIDPLTRHGDSTTASIELRIEASVCSSIARRFPVEHRGRVGFERLPLEVGTVMLHQKTHRPFITPLEG